jgi:L-seryl-tRNA(Ser) seleniumtransferase
VSEYRVIPSIDHLRKRPGVAALERAHGTDATLGSLRLAADALRAAIADGTAASPSLTPDQAAERIEADTARRLAVQFHGSLIPVINATGVIVHTNLGRAPLAAAAIERIAGVARGYTNLEFDLARGERGSRTEHAAPLLTTLTGAEAALVVNNNAAAVLLTLTALAKGREVIISRGELVEIGGGFRVPEVMAQSGAILREVGTTNRTRIADYTSAVGERTALILRVHRSNFRMDGFVEQPTLAALVDAGRRLGVPVVEDRGSGSLADDIEDEPSLRSSLAAGASLVCFSGDKLLGGPQAGVIVGQRALIEQLRTHPLMRALRVDKLTLAALEGTLIEYLAGREAATVPIARMMAQTVDAIEERARAIGEMLGQAGWRVALVSGMSAIGGGSAPGVELPTVLLAIARADHSASDLEARLRALDPPVIARIVDDRVVLDLRTVLEDEDELLSTLLVKI